MAKSKKTVLKSLALITQLGIMIITPIALCVALGLFIDHLAGTNWIFIPLMVLGMIAGVTSVYKTVMKVVKQDEAEKAMEQDPVTEKLLNSLKAEPYTSQTKPYASQEEPNTSQEDDL